MTTVDATRGLGERDGLRWWPSVLGLLIGIGAGLDINGVDVAWVVTISAFVYVGAAATGSGMSAWWWFLGSLPLITLEQIFDAPAGLTWAVLVIAALVAAWGIARGRWSDPGGLSLQSLAMVAFGAMSLLAFVVDTTAGGLLVAAGLVGHATWDLYHHRTNRVVVRSYAEVCMVLDVALAVMIVVAVLS
jgi:hypothetical protein